MKIHPHFRLLFAALFGTSLLSLSHRASGQEDPTPPPADKSPAQASPERPVQPEPPAKGATREDEKNVKEKPRKEADESAAAKPEPPRRESDKPSSADGEKARGGEKERDTAQRETLEPSDRATRQAEKNRTEKPRKETVDDTDAARPESSQRDTGKPTPADEEKARRADKQREAAPPATPPKPPGSENRPGQPGVAQPPAETADKDRPDRPADSTGTDTAPPAPQQPEQQQQAETEVREATREVERELEARKTKIRDRNDAQAVIDEVLGAESRISKAELARERRAGLGARSDRDDDRRSVASPEQRREAANYFRQRLRGEKVDVAPPPLLRGEARRRAGGERVEVETRREVRRPRYLNEGRRYVHFQSRSTVPAILLAAEAMNRVRFQPVREIAPIFYERETVRETQVAALPPDNYRSDDSVVLSYPVDENSMISSEDILFVQGSTQFADPLSYDIISSLADAIKELPSEERFVVEGHASAEGSYDDNMVLSQQRAERIVREIVRRGVQPNRLLPVGYGESEARHPENAEEALRSEDRRVVVFRLKEQTTAAR
jgi:outer membrane protein OmpA-like peptidoglycan-associated protein